MLFRFFFPKDCGILTFSNNELPLAIVTGISFLAGVVFGRLFVIPPTTFDCVRNPSPFTMGCLRIRFNRMPLPLYGGMNIYITRIILSVRVRQPSSFKDRYERTLTSFSKSGGFVNLHLLKIDTNEPSHFFDPYSRWKTQTFKN